MCIPTVATYQSHFQSPHYPYPVQEQATRTSGIKHSAMTGFLSLLPVLASG